MVDDLKGEYATGTSAGEAKLAEIVEQIKDQAATAADE